MILPRQTCVSSEGFKVPFKRAFCLPALPQKRRRKAAWNDG